MIKTTVRYIALPPNSRHCCQYDDTYPWCVFGYTYIRKPDHTDPDIDDHPVTHIELRPDVDILDIDTDGYTIAWDYDKPCPFVQMDDVR